jgi:hypothetical protein
MFPRFTALFAVLTLVTLAAVSAQSRPGQQPARDTSAREAAPAPTGSLTGRVVAADTGRPIKRARVFVTAPELEEGRAAMTDDSGVFEIGELPAGRYSVTVGKAGFITLAYGQRRPLQGGTPLQLGDGQQLKGVDFRLPRGGVISGHVFDEDGDPMPGAMVRVLRYQYSQGDRRLVPAGVGQSDDRGEFRVWGLNPGDYYVNATARNFGGGRFGFGRGGFGGRGGPFGPAAGGQDGEDELGYAPTYFPGVASVAEARAISLDISQEVDNIDFGIQLVHTARISGTVSNPDGSPSSSGNVMVMPETAAGGRGQIGMAYGGRIQWDGSFAVANVAPGRYTIRARGNDTDPPMFAEQPISVNGGDVSGVVVILQPGATIGGTVAFQSSGIQTSAPNPADVRIVAPSFEQGSIGPNPTARADKNGAFTLEGVPAGTHLLRANGVPRGWTLKSVTAGGQDVTDTPLSLRPGQKLTGVVLLFTDRLTQISGTATTSDGAPATGVTVLAFPTDQTLWRPQARQIMTTRPDQNGSYQLRGLPPGEYYLTTVDPTEPGEWFEPSFLEQHQTGASRVTLGEGDSVVKDLVIKN